MIVPARRPAAAHEALDDLPGTEVHGAGPRPNRRSVRAFAARFLRPAARLTSLIMPAPDHGLSRDRWGQDGGTVRGQPSRPLLLVNLSLACNRRRRRTRRRCLVRGASHHRHPLGRHPLPDQPTTDGPLMAGLQDGQRAVRRRPGCARTAQRALAPSPPTREAFSLRSNATCRGRRWSMPAGSTSTATASTRRSRHRSWVPATKSGPPPRRTLRSAGGVYCEDAMTSPRSSMALDATPGGVRPYAIDEAAADRSLGRLGRRLIGVRRFRQRRAWPRQQLGIAVGAPSSCVGVRPAAQSRYPRLPCRSAFARLGLDRKLVRAVAHRHERAPERMSVDRASHLHRAHAYRRARPSTATTTYVQPPLAGLTSMTAVNCTSNAVASPTRVAFGFHSSRSGRV